MELDRIEARLTAMLACLEKLEKIQMEKQQALESIDPDRLTQSSEGEAGFMEEMAPLLAELAATQARPDEPSLRTVLATCSAQDRARLQQELAAVRATALRVRQKLHANWMVTYRLNEHVLGVLEIIAGAGTPQGSESSDGGLFLDGQA